jgi:phospholipase/lecithinase/hemolysin
LLEELLKEENIMKKLMIAALSVLTVLAFSTSAMAAATAPVLDNASQNVVFGGEATYDMSNKVYVDYGVDDTTNAQRFSITTVHSGGNRMFTTNSETSVIWYMTVDKGNATPVSVDEDWTTGQFESDAAWNSL